MGELMHKAKTVVINVRKTGKLQKIDWRRKAVHDNWWGKYLEY